MWIDGSINVSKRRNITQEHNLKELENQLLFQKGLLEVIPNPVFIKDANARFVFFNTAYEKAFGINRENLIGKSVMDLEYLPKEDRIKYQKEDIEMIATGSVISKEIDFVFADQKIHHCLYWSCGMQGLDKVGNGLIGFIVDITEQKKTEKELLEKINELNKIRAKIELITKIDDLTQIANRRFFLEELKKSVSIAERYQSPLCLLMLDLDDFKLINDSYGHAMGDEVLIDFATILKESCREEDFVARSGGEEFYVINPMTDLAGAKMWAKRLQDRIRESSVDGIKYTASIGIVEYIENEGMNSFLKRADDMMYKAKELGKNKLCSQDD